MDSLGHRQELFFKLAEDCSGWSDQWIVRPQISSNEQSILNWKSTNAEVTGKKRNLKDFSSSLKTAGIADTTAVDLPGCWVVLPHGSNLSRVFSDKIEQAYAAVGLDRYDYPMIAPLENFERASKVLPLKDQVLYVGTDSDFEAQKPRAGLCPTGEEVIYEHWRQMVKTREDLPIEMYRQARFYRPQTSSRASGVFRSMENADLYEFHSCFPDAQIATQRMQDYFEMLKGLSKEVHIPAIFGIRPIWTNQHRVSYLTIAGDTPLPISGTVQTFCLYMQGQSFSSVLPVTYKDHGKQFYTEHVTGAVSRRLMLTHLMLGWNNDGSFFVHPDMSPTACKLFYVPREISDHDAVKSLADAVTKIGIKTRIEVINDPRRIRAVASKAKAESVPLRVYIHGRRHENDKFKVVFERSSDQSEASIFVENINDALPNIIAAEIDALKGAHARRMSDFMDGNVIPCNDLGAASEVVRANKAALMPLSLTHDAVAKVDSLDAGEVVGFVPSSAFPERPNRCVVTGAETKYVACFTKRI